MFVVGDVVKLHPKFIGSNYLFQVWHINRDSVGFYYNLKRVEQELDLTRGSSKWQLDLIERIEHQDWRDDELIPVESFSARINTSPATISINSDGIKLVNNTTTIMDEFKRIQKSLEEFTNKELKEDNMKILDIYDARKRGQIEAEIKNKKDEILAKDEIQKIIKEMTKQVNTILENEAREDRYWVDKIDLYQESTMDELDDLEEEKEKKLNKLHSTIEEIKALFELTEDFQERMKILKKYGIIDKEGKLSI